MFRRDAHRSSRKNSELLQWCPVVRTVGRFHVELRAFGLGDVVRSLQRHRVLIQVCRRTRERHACEVVLQACETGRVVRGKEVRLADVAAHHVE